MAMGFSVAGLPPQTKLPAEAGRLLPSTEALREYARSLDARAKRSRYPALSGFARNIGLSEETLIASYELEDRFHDLILAEPSIEIRRRLNDEVYTKAFELYGVKFTINLDATSSPKDALVGLLKDELEGRAILDVGCGGGDFLLSCSRNLRYERLHGIDVFAKDITVQDKKLRFQRGDVVRFSVDEPFDVAVTDNVYEHIAPQDVADHLASIFAALKPGGRVVILTPHRAFGPWDVTRIVDDSNCGWLPARGTHINESTYGELADKLTVAGFVNLCAVHPKARVGKRPNSSRVDISRLRNAESRPKLMRFLQSMDKRYRYQSFEICMIGTRPQR